MKRRTERRRRLNRPTEGLFPYRILPGGLGNDPAVAPAMKLYSSEREAMSEAPVRPSDLLPPT